MTTFDEREEGFEKKFAHDEELKFKAEARRNRMLGLWAADKLGLSGDAAAVYAREIVSAALDGTGDAGVTGKVAADLAAKGATPSAGDVRAKMAELLAVAVAQLKADK